MDKRSLLINSKSAIIKRWFEAAADSYPADTAVFLKNKKNAFDNPVGSSIRDGMDGILDGLIAAILGEGGKSGLDQEKIAPFMDRIVRIRAVQSFPPSRSLVFISELKKILRSVLGKNAEQTGLDFKELDAYVDELLFIAFDQFVGCRQKLFEIKIEDEKRRLHMLLRRAKLIVENPEEAEVGLPDLRNRGFETNQ